MRAKVARRIRKSLRGKPHGELRKMKRLYNRTPRPLREVFVSRLPV